MSGTLLGFPKLKNSLETVSDNFSHQFFVGQNIRTEWPFTTVSRLKVWTEKMQLLYNKLEVKETNVNLVHERKHNKDQDYTKTKLRLEQD